MPISGYSPTPASNTSINGINIAEGCPPSGINDAIRQLMADIVTGAVLQQAPTTTGSSNAYLVTLAPAPASYYTPLTFTCIANFANTAAATINVNGLGVKNIFKPSASGISALAGGEIQIGQPVYLIYDGTQFVMINPNLLAGKNTWSGDQNFTITSGTIQHVCEGRLTLTSGVPVTTSDVTAATNIYFTPFGGNSIALYTFDTSRWALKSFTETTLSLSGLAADTNYDVFLYITNTTDTPVIEANAWSNATTRATPLVLQDGVYVKSGNPYRRYLGTFRTTATIGQTEDSGVGGGNAKRYLWNYYNRQDATLSRKDSTASWVYSTATVRQANANTNNKFEVVVGIAEDAQQFSTVQHIQNNTGANGIQTGVGIDSTTVFSGTPNGGQVSNFNCFPNTINTVLSAGYHYIAQLESGAGANTQTWFGSGVYQELFGKVRR